MPPELPLIGQLDSILHLTSEGIIAIDSAGVIRVCNDAAAKLIGVDPSAAAIGQRVTALLPRTRLLDVVATGECLQEAKRRFGDRIAIARCRPIVHEGAVIGAVASFQDLTELEQALGRLGAADLALSRLESVLDNAFEALVLIDRDGVITYVNRSMSDLFGIPRDAAVGRPIADVIPDAQLPLLLKTREPEVGLYRLKDRDLVVKRIPIMHNGEVVAAAAMVLFKDVQEVRELYSRLNLLERRIETYKRELDKVWASKYRFAHILGISAAITAMKALAERAARTASPVLIVGESGTGKELFAHSIHFASPRSGRPFIRVDCSSIPRELLESELFGHEPGAFTGASRSAKPGKFELAQEGTVFLDEIGDMPLDMQAKLLRVLQEKEVVRVGGTRPIPLDFRVLAATHQDLEKKVREGTFREDLYYRLDVIRLTVPPLRERRDDVPILVTHLVNRFARDVGAGPITIDEEALEILCGYSWPGNVRQLANVLERALTGLDGDVIRPTDLPASIKAGRGGGDGRLREAVRTSEEAAIEAALREAGGNVSKAAKILGVHRSVLYKKVSRLHLPTDVSSPGRDN